VAKAKFFKTPANFREWLQKNHGSKKELLVGFYRKGSGKKSITWPESVEQALCFGWIDGIRKSIDEESYSIRFTPRKAGSNWSAVNLDKIKLLKKKKLLQPAGEKIFNERKSSKNQYSYEKKPVKLNVIYEKRFKENERAWKWFSAMPTYYRKTAIHWVMSAKKEETREKRLNTLIADSEHGRKIKPLSY
jgi:uncharacterized protein YdeI (YjbR/CyaY-like superfamily)